MMLDVFRWDDEKQAPFYEVEASKPIEENIETNPTGITFRGGRWRLPLQVSAEARGVADLRTRPDQG
jgi:hypothetical protein